MACIDDEWESFLSEGSSILSNEKSSAKNNITKSYSVCDKLSDTANNIVDTRFLKSSIVGGTTGTTSIAKSSKLQKIEINAMLPNL